MRSRPELLALALTLAACDDDGGRDPAAQGSSSDGGDEVDDSTGATESSSSSSGAAESSSTGDESSTGGVPSAVPGRECPPDSFLDATNFGVPFFTTWCTGCHSSDLVGDAERQMAPEEYDFDSMDGIRTNLLLVYSTAADDYDKMPPAGGPSTEDRERLGEWLACGAP